MEDGEEEIATSDGIIPSVIFWSGVVLLLWSVLEPIGLVVLDSSVQYTPKYMIGYVTYVPASLGVIWVGRWLPGSDIPSAYYRSIGTYCAAGGGGFLVFNLGLMLFFPSDSVWYEVSWIRWALSLGMIVGLYVGVSRAQAIFQTIKAERQSVRADQLEEQRDIVDQMNDLLRHEVLNTTQAILGTITLLQEQEDPINPADERLERIHQQGEALTEVIRDVRSLLQVLQDDQARETINLTDLLRSEIQAIVDRYPAVTVKRRLTSDVLVAGDELLGRVFGNLLENTVEHNDLDSLTITVDVETTDESVSVTIQDDGSGIPEDKLDSLFDRPERGDHGLGLYLVRELVDSYDGTLELVNTGAHGTTFRVSFPTVSPESADSLDEGDHEPVVDATDAGS